MSNFKKINKFLACCGVALLTLNLPAFASAAASSSDDEALLASVSSRLVIVPKKNLDDLEAQFQKVCNFNRYLLLEASPDALEYFRAKMAPPKSNEAEEAERIKSLKLLESRVQESAIYSDIITRVEKQVRQGVVDTNMRILRIFPPNSTMLTSPAGSTISYTQVVVPATSSKKLEELGEALSSPTTLTKSISRLSLTPQKPQPQANN